ncbi:MAG: hypothetical protein CMM15_10175 [Rhodospirillaceae bacterium]|nr:hypothetical protein [Rhodospirillaceae bacterium]OUU21873.1 MAG: hypothetical protein CBB97_15820 [Candidatus Endolissoclinum sp. TMED37]|tara:strand:- start:890 stop:1918 length:1029 start_codon:yes stop_codon:yes gene_type:complete
MEYQVRIVSSDKELLMLLSQLKFEEATNCSVFNKFEYCIYQKIYNLAISDAIEASHLVISKDKNIFAFLPLYSVKNKGIYEFTSNFTFICEPTCRKDLSLSQERHLMKTFANKLSVLFDQYDVKKFNFEINSYRSNNIICEWHKCLLERFDIASNTQYAAITNLENAKLPSKKFIRKSYRSLINSGLKIWKSFVADEKTINKEFWDKFIELHFQSAGRKTRSEETWNYQFELIKKNLAFSVGLFDPFSGTMVGCAFYQHNHSQAYYMVGAYDRSLFDKPIGHVVQWIALNYALKKGLTEICYLNEIKFNVSEFFTEKEQRIQFFKLGFCNEVKNIVRLQPKN